MQKAKAGPVALLCTLFIHSHRGELCLISRLPLWAAICRDNHDLCSGHGVFLLHRLCSEHGEADTGSLSGCRGHLATCTSDRISGKGKKLFPWEWGGKERTRSESRGVLSMTDSQLSCSGHKVIRNAGFWLGSCFIPKCFCDLWPWDWTKNKRIALCSCYNSVLVRQGENRSLLRMQGWDQEDFISFPALP